MPKALSAAVLAASLLAGALALSVQAQARDSDAVPAPAASTAVTARAQSTVPAVKRVRKAGTQQRRVASVASPARYHPQCFFFWCTAGGRPFNFLVLGVAY